VRKLFVAAAAALVLCGPAQAQTADDPIVTHYRAYRAALQSNDLPRAEIEAAAALVASEARDGDGGRTAVLALNLALVRIDAGQIEAALAPARRAHDIAQTLGAEAGVDPNAARLTLARVSLALGAAGADGELNAALRAAEAAGGPADHIQPAALQYGSYLFAQARYEESRAIWVLAANFVTGDGMQRDYNLARIKTGEGAALMMQAIDARAGRRERFRASYDAFMTARDLLEPIAARESASGDMTLGQLALADALAWRGALRGVARDRSMFPDDEDEAPQGDGLFEMDQGGSAPRCKLELDHGHIEYPREALSRSHVGAVVVRLVVNEASQVVHSGVVSRVGSPAFVEAVEDASRGWSVERHEDAEPGCRMAATVFVPVVFVFE
jgi:TonB family protein